MADSEGARLILRGENHKVEKIQAKNKGKRCRTNQEAGSVEGRTGFEVSRPETGGTRTLLQIGLRRRSFHLKRSQGLVLKLHFKENAFS